MKPVRLLVLLLGCMSRVGAEMSLRPDSQTVLAGEEARFTCSTGHSEWGAMVWQLKGKTVLTISQQNGPVASLNPNITAERQGDGWSLVLRNTQRQQEGEVSCDLQEVDKRTAQLYVQDFLTYMQVHVILSLWRSSSSTPSSFEKGSVRISGESRMALKGHSVEFECQAAGWFPKPELHWRLNGREVSSADYNLTSAGAGPGQISVSSHLNVSASSSCDVHCLVSVSAMTAPLSSTVRLIVVAEVLEEEQDLTVAVAILGSLSGLLLLALLCIGIVFCLKRRGRTKPGLQQPIWFSQSESSGISVAGEPQGKVNLAYSGERDIYINGLIIGPPMPITTSLDKVPDVVSSSSLSFQTDTQSEASTKIVRSVTTV